MKTKTSSAPPDLFLVEVELSSSFFCRLIQPPQLTRPSHQSFNVAIPSDEMLV
jgi:hypothetical protein